MVAWLINYQSVLEAPEVFALQNVGDNWPGSCLLTSFIDMRLLGAFIHHGTKVESGIKYVTYSA